MTALLSRIHARVGDFWWYSAMIFVACRTGDVINAFIGLWLVPKYVGPGELGAVLPLQQLTSFLTIPLGVVTIVFTKQVNTYATRGEYGKVKSLVRDVLGISAAIFLVCIAGAYLIMPFFYTRLRISSGLLTVLVLASGFVGALASLVGATQQGLKRFKTMTVMNLIGAPVRLVTMLVAMPIRALSGYMLGQATPTAVTTLLSAFDTHRVLKPYEPDTTWRRDWREIWSYTWPIAIYTAFNLVFATATATVYRQRLPELESAANYMLGRFAEIAGYIGGSISVVLFPLVSESHEKGQENSGLLHKAVLGTFIPTVLLSVIFIFSSDWILSLTDTWSVYKPFSDLLPLLTLITGAGTIIGASISYEIACRRFGIVAFVTGFNLLWIIILISFTGYEFFNGLLPNGIVLFMKNCHLASLRTIIWVSIVSAVFQLAVIRLIYVKRHVHSA